MSEIDFIKAFIEPLADTRLNYFITGSVAGTLYGEPRLTHDLDLVLVLRSQDVDSFLESSGEGGSENHLRDIKNILRVMGERIDTTFVMQQAPKRRVQMVWQELGANLNVPI